MPAGCDRKSLAVEPKVLICDEATSALDVTIQKQIMELLEDLKEKKGLSFILSVIIWPLFKCSVTGFWYCMRESSGKRNSR